MRDAALFRAGWSGYSGPLFSHGVDPREIERCQIGDVLHEQLRTLRELTTTLSLLATEGHPPNLSSYRMLIALCRLVTAAPELLANVYRFDDALELVTDLEALAMRLGQHNAIAGNQIIDTAAAVRDAIERKGNHGQEQEQESKG